VPVSAPEGTDPVRPALRLKDAYVFFAPLVLMVELNMISKSAIHAFLARTETPSVTLAAFNAAFTLYYALTSATELIAVLCLSYLKSRADIFRLLGFIALVLLIPVLLVVAVALTCAGAMVFGDWFGLGLKAQAEARQACILLLFSMPILLLRGVAFAILMLNRRTLVITWSTLIRLLSLGVSLVILPHWLNGAAIGAGALVFCMFAETVFAWCMVWPNVKALPPRRASRDTVAGYWRFSWPLMINQSAEMGVVFTINVLLGRLEQAELAIAAFGVAHGLVSLLMGPMRNLLQTAQTLVARREDVRTMLVFTSQLVAIFTVLALALFQTSLRETVLHDVMGLTPELAAYCAPAVGIAFLMAAFWSSAALFRGLLAKARTTTSLAFSGSLRIITAGLIASLSLAYADFNGALLGVAAWIGSYVVEALFSAWRLRRLGWYTEA
jgi:progressive ankylosis protein